MVECSFAPGDLKTTPPGHLLCFYMTRSAVSDSGAIFPRPSRNAWNGRLLPMIVWASVVPRRVRRQLGVIHEDHSGRWNGDDR